MEAGLMKILSKAGVMKQSILSRGWINEKNTVQIEAGAIK